MRRLGSECRFRSTRYGEGARHAQTYITFALDAVYGAAIEHIREIVPAGGIRHLPGQIDYVQGFINLRAEVIPVINLRRYFGIKDDRGDKGLIVIFTRDNRQLGVLVDQLMEIVSFDHMEERKVPKLLLRREETRFRGMLAQIIEITDEDGDPIPVMILDVVRLMTAMTASGESDVADRANPSPEQAVNA